MLSMRKVIYTIGHSNLDAKTFVSLLTKHSVEVLVDVRRFPTSKFEHFKIENLKSILKENDIDYVWISELGGFRKRILKNSPNIAIKSEGFRNYADYMLTQEFKQAIGNLIEIAKNRIVAIMCAEKFYWRCHRKFIADYLTILGFEVRHIIDNNVKVHKLSKYARIVGDTVIYNKI